MNATIRQATPVDAEALGHLHLDVWDDAYTGLMPQQLLDDRREKVAERIERWRDILTSGAGTTYVAAGPDGLVGFASAGPGRDPDLDLELELTALYVRATSWGTGVGHALLIEAIGDGPSYCWVLAGNERALRFYERQGFTLDGSASEHEEGRHVRMVRR